MVLGGGDKTVDEMIKLDPIRDLYYLFSVSELSKSDENHGDRLHSRRQLPY